MSKLVCADKWCARHFEPGSEPPIDKLHQWVMETRCGQVIAGQLYINDDAISPPAPKLTGGDLLA